jgi:hypothetical protein
MRPRIHAFIAMRRCGFDDGAKLSSAYLGRR